MKILKRNHPKSFLDLPKKKQKKLLLKAAKGANKRQQDLERQYLNMKAIKEAE